MRKVGDLEPRLCTGAGTPKSGLHANSLAVYREMFQVIRVTKSLPCTGGEEDASSHMQESQVVLIDVGETTSRLHTILIRNSYHPLSNIRGCRSR